jgi:hypothetical protein
MDRAMRNPVLLLLVIAAGLVGADARGVPSSLPAAAATTERTPGVDARLLLAELQRLDAAHKRADEQAQALARARTELAQERALLDAARIDLELLRTESCPPFPAPDAAHLGATVRARASTPASPRRCSRT